MSGSDPAPSSSPVIDSSAYGSRRLDMDLGRSGGADEGDFAFPSSFPLPPPASSAPSDLPEEELSEVDKAWRATHEDKQAYWRLFRRYATHIPGQEPSVDRRQAQRMFAGFNIPDRRTLYKIWKLADIGKRGFLHQENFVIALHLATGVSERKLDLPPTLPCTLQPSALKHFAVQPRKSSHKVTRKGRGAGGEEVVLDAAQVRDLERRAYHHQQVAEHLCKNPRARGELMNAYRFHADKVVRQWGLAGDQLRRMRTQYDEFEGMLRLQDELIKEEEAHGEQLGQDIARQDQQAGQREQDHITMRSELAALEAEVRAAEGEHNAARSAVRSMDMTLSQLRMGIEHLQADLRTSERLREHQQKLAAARI